MNIFNLPQSTVVNKVIPKKAFESYTNAKQKKQFTDYISQITWLNKISSDSVNLEAREIIEIQVFLIKLKINEDIQQVLNVIDKAIPYNIIFIVEYEERIYLSTSTKHPHPVNQDNAVIDWTFKSNWFVPVDNTYSLQLKTSIDTVYYEFCVQLSGKLNISTKTLHELNEYKQNVYMLEKEISKLKSSIAKCKQFNHKVEMNIKLRALENEFAKLLNS